MLNDSVAMFQGIGEKTPNECNVSYDEDFVPVAVSVEVSLGTKLAHAQVEC